MGKQSRKSKKVGSKPTDNANLKQNNLDEASSIKIYDNDTAVFISMAQQLKEEGNKLFQTKCYDTAIFKYQKALKLLPGNHLDVPYLHSNIAACYMQMGITDFPRAIHECNLALEITPKYSKALLKRARCYEALNRLDLALNDVNTVLDIEPNNLMAAEILERVNSRMGDKLTEEKVNESQQDVNASQIPEPLKEKVHKKKRNKPDKKREKPDRVLNDLEKDEKKTEDKLVVEEKVNVINTKEEEPKRVVKLVYGEDIRFAKIPFNCDILKVREIVSDRFPVSKAVLIKYKDEENDMVTITTNEELKWAESSTSGQSALRLYIVEVNPEQDLFFDHIKNREKKEKLLNSSACIDDWILGFAQLFKNYVGFNTDSYWGLHELGMKVYAEAMEEVVTSQESQDLFNLAANNFQEMVALAYFNWGNVHMSRARKRVYDSENDSQNSPKKSVLLDIKDSYEWTQMEYLKAGERYKEAIKIKPDFYEGFLALGQQQFEQAKLSWYYAIGTKTNLETWNSAKTVRLYNEAEYNMEKGFRIWEEVGMKQVGEVLRPNEVKLELKKTELGKYVKDFTQDEMGEVAANVRSRVNILWGTMFYERSMMEYKLGVSDWRECLEIAVEKFELAGASQAHIGVMIKNHCSNDTAPDGVGFNIDEIVQAWNDMYDAKMWQVGVPSFVLELLLQRRVPKIFHALKQT
ncbi:protein PHOX1-like isoform X1 [Bidens hawaiensis]|uniref:protein PHOX1-like isoform X1 n=1 Tax=Bidens hawaiensis TaxID=980011 RepID=UPI00404910F5